MAKKITKRPSRNAWSEMTNLAERVVESVRKLLQRLIEAVTPRPAHPAPESRMTKAAQVRRAPHKKVTHRTVKRAA
jgi:hypothetical protein